VPLPVDLRWPSEKLLIGVAETHGTREVPLFVEALSRRLADDGYLVVLLPELPMSALGFLEEDRRDRASHRLSESAWWGREMQDGRSGVATACALWRLSDVGQSIDILGVDEESYTNEREAFMGSRIGAAAKGRLTERVAVVYWAGNLHVLEMPGRPPNAFAQALTSLEGFHPLTIEVNARSGVAFNCQADGCGPHPFPDNSGARTGLTKLSSREWIFTFDEFSAQMPVSTRSNGSTNVLEECGQE
jgi:hypothetical protein